MADQFSPPTLYNTPLPDLFVSIAQKYPNRDFAQIIQEFQDSPRQSTRVKWSTFIQHAQNTAADLRIRWAQCLQDGDAKTKVEHPRRPGDPVVVVALLATNGYQYYVNLIGCTLNRWTVLLISPKNSPAAIEHLLRVANVSLLLVDSGAMEFEDVLKFSLPGLSIQTIATIDKPSCSPAASPLTPLSSVQIEVEMKLPVFYMHTSGSTGHPKIIPWTHDFVLSGSRTRRRDGAEYIGLPLYSVPPLCHAMGMFAYVMHVLSNGNLITFIASQTPKPPSAAALLEHLPYIKGGIVTLPPSVLEDLCDLGLEAMMNFAQATHGVIFAGAPLKSTTGNALVSAGVKVITAYGSTEINMGTKMRPQSNPEDWEYVEFREGYEWHLLPVDGDPLLRELIVSPGPQDCPAVINHENPRGFATNDLWAPHPSVPNLWKLHSRKGDITLLSNGEKANNLQVESLLLADKHILQVQVFGAGRPLIGVILKPADSTMNSLDFLSVIEPTVRHANSVLPKHSRLLSELIIVGPSNKSFPVTDKNTIKRKETLELFKEEIEASYAMLEQGAGGNDVSFGGNVTDELAVREFVRATVRHVLDHDVPDQEDLFEHGLDSLLSIRIRAALISMVKKTPTATLPVPRNVTYTFPSINSLTKYLVSRADPDWISTAESTHKDILRIISKYSADIPLHKRGTHPVQGEVVALTGSTGSLGSCLLMKLLQRKSVSKVYLLNRGGSGTQKERQAKALRERGLNPTVLDDERAKIVYMKVDLSRHDFGLSQTEYAELCDNLTHIIHSAWQVNFNLVLNSYERIHVAGLRHLIDLACSSPQPQTPRFIFLSSIAAVGMYRGPSQFPTQGDRAGQILVPEEQIEDPSIPMPHGYGQAKYACERILVNASKAGLQTTIIRIGQLSGIVENGIWTRSEHVPIIFRSSMTLGVIPNDLDSVRWVPADIAASAIVKQSFAPSSNLQYFHVENTFCTPWRDIAEAASRASRIPLTVVSFAAWLEYIRKVNPDPEKVPAMRLLDFFSGMAHGGVTVALGWQKSAQVSPELAVGPIPLELVKKYVLYQAQ